MTALSSLDQERLEILAGTRAHADKRKQAVRVGDLDELVRYSHRLKSKTVNAAPTQSEHNALVDDVRRIHETLQSMAKQLNEKLGLK